MQSYDSPEIEILGFHVSRLSRDKYRYPASLISARGLAALKHFRDARLFAKVMNDRRDLLNFPERAVRAGQLNAMALIEGILHDIIRQYCRQNAGVLGRALDTLGDQFGDEAVEKTLKRYLDSFPPVSVHARLEAIDSYLSGQAGEWTRREEALEGLITLWVANMNPAYAPYLELFDDAELERDPVYPAIIIALQEFFDQAAPFSTTGLSLLSMLRSPALASPHSLTGQLDFILARWGAFIGHFLYRILASLDLIKEEEKAIFGGPGPARVYTYAGLDAEPEHFSMDKEWMPNLVLVAKNAHVWLDQLSKRYQRSITRLDEIPDEELDTLARRGFSGLWLIGMWQRSGASQRIKQLCGNGDAVASAYSIFDYAPADDLGGEAALENLRERAWRRGIRLASDMVPNHMGIDSRWMMQHPDWFISLDHSPFPSYSFNGPNLSWDERVGIYIDDHYYERSDAAVVFKRVDHFTGDVKYIYHGNDGTNMPWNDTAQLNFLDPRVREAVIQTILHVARQFPIIRFDAAMTLAKRHYQRLWFPEPGSGGAIPTRAEHGLTRDQLNEAMPVEFWREVVDRVAQEAPDTLLLAEAFWLMEGYFVRTLGMHRVYNSAFMNMLRDEDNAKYRSVIKNTLEFDPEVLKRFVNFMNNPDERTAVEQFGKGDKYFGICVLLATLPGLPMFGHGQVEGFAEKYGMEYRRAYWDEHPDGYLIDRHEREIFPLLHRRQLFAEAREFLLYDFFTGEGHVNEDVFAYSNRAGDERGVVIYHNKYGNTRGWVRMSSGYAVKGLDGEKRIVQRSLCDGLGITPAENGYVLFRDHVSGLEFIRHSCEVRDCGIFVELAAYQYHVFLDFREVFDADGQYSRVAAYLNGRGASSIEGVMRDLVLQPLRQGFKAVLNAEMIRRVTHAQAGEIDELLEDFADRLSHALDEARIFSRESGGSEAPAAARETLRAALTGADEEVEAFLADDELRWAILLCWIALRGIGSVVDPTNEAITSRALLDEWQLGRVVTELCYELGADEGAAHWALAMTQMMISQRDWWVEAEENDSAVFRQVSAWLGDADIQRAIQVNRHQDVLWFNREAFDETLTWLALVASLQARFTGVEFAAGLVAALRKAETASEYQVEKLLALCRPKKAATGK